MLGYQPRHFQLYELVPKFAYENIDHYKLWVCWRPEVLWTADMLRETYGKMVVNDWFWGGDYQYRGWRPQHPPIGERWSNWTQHAWWNALDCKFQDVTTDQVREDIKANRYPVVFQHIRCIEEGTSWLHFDCRNVQQLLIVKP